jgi:hypothetical protein
MIRLKRESQIAENPAQILHAFSPEDLVDETFISVANNARAARAAIDDYLRCSAVEITPDHEATSTYMQYHWWCRPEA